MTTTAVLLINCPDRRGLVAAIANFLVAEYDANVLNADQHQDAALGSSLCVSSSQPTDLAKKRSFKRPLPHWRTG